MNPDAGSGVWNQDLCSPGHQVLLLGGQVYPLPLHILIAIFLSRRKCKFYDESELEFNAGYSYNRFIIMFNSIPIISYNIINSIITMIIISISINRITNGTTIINL